MLMRELFEQLPEPELSALPQPLQALMQSPIDVCDDFERAETLILKAVQAFPERLEISVALYKMYAFFNYSQEALALIDQVIIKAANQVGISADWNTLNAQSTQWLDAEGPTRVLLFSLKARGFVSMRNGDLESAHKILYKLRQLDSQDQVGGSTVLEMAERAMEASMEADV